MKRTLLILATGLFICIFSITTDAQTTTDYFTGKWNLTIIGTPNGDSKMIANLERKDGKLAGEMTSEPAMGDPITISQIEEKENSVKLFFNAGGYDIYIFLEKTDDNHLKGTMLDMFETKGERVVAR